MFNGLAKRLDDIDLPKLGSRLGVGEDELHAFLDVETRGTGFDDQGRPRMLFEPHVFYRLLSADKRKIACQKGLAYKDWGTKPYPRDSYPRLLEAMKIDAEIALQSCSWGLAQVMGFNHKLAGYASAEAMVKAFTMDEEFHLEAAVKFILACKLDDELRGHKWAAFAEGYNGKGYKKNEYDKKLADAFRKWQRIKDTPYVEELKPVVLPPEVPKPTEVVKPVEIKMNWWQLLVSAIKVFFSRG